MLTVNSLVIIPEDKTVAVNGAVLTLDLTALVEAGVHRVYWMRNGQDKWLQYSAKYGDERVLVEEPAKHPLLAPILALWEQTAEAHRKSRDGFDKDKQRREEARQREAAETAAQQAKESEEAKAKAEAALTYAQRRAREYPPLAEQIGALVKANHADAGVRAQGEKELAALQAQIAAVKSKYPKA